MSDSESARFRDLWERRREHGLLLTLVAGSVLLLLGAWLVNSLHVDDRPTLAETVETLTPPPDAQPKPKEVDMAVDRVVNGRVGVDLSRDSGATCERVNRTRYSCSVKRGDDDIATGWWVRCPPPRRSLDAWAESCSLSRKMTPRERCEFGVRSGDPSSGTQTWNKEALICLNLGVPIG